MFCLKCGSELLEGERFCSNCGAPVEQTEPEKNYSDEEPAKPPVTPRKKRNYEEEWAKQEKKEKTIFFVLGAVIIILVVAIVMGVVSLMSEQTKNNDAAVSKLNEEMKAEMAQSQSATASELLENEESQET